MEDHLKTSTIFIVVLGIIMIFTVIVIGLALGVIVAHRWHHANQPNGARPEREPPTPPPPPPQYVLPPGADPAHARVFPRPLLPPTTGTPSPVQKRLWQPPPATTPDDLDADTRTKVPPDDVYGALMLESDLTPAPTARREADDDQEDATTIQDDSPRMTTASPPAPVKPPRHRLLRR